MKNLTITVDDAVLEWARIEAAKRATSVSRLVGEMLGEKMRQEDAYAQAQLTALQFPSWGVSKPAANGLAEHSYERLGIR